MTVETVALSWSEGCNIIVGQAHFIKTVEDVAEIMAASVPGAKWGLAFNEASPPFLVRTEGNDSVLVSDAVACALASGAGHSFYLVLGPGLFPIQVLDRIKACSEVTTIFAATGNPLSLVVARETAAERAGGAGAAGVAGVAGAGIRGVIDGGSPAGVEGEADKLGRRALLRRFGYKFG
jgi:adenosine/AMP kinase